MDAHEQQVDGSRPHLPGGSPGALKVAETAKSQFTNIVDRTGLIAMVLQPIAAQRLAEVHAED